MNTRPMNQPPLSRGLRIVGANDSAGADSAGAGAVVGATGCGSIQDGRVASPGGGAAGCAPG